MKRGVLIILFSLMIIGLIGIVSAASCSSPDQTIMKLSSDTNSHGALWDDTHSYPTEICYNQIFSPQTGNGNHNGNVLLYLGNAYNSHASTTSDATYATAVKYGDLTCRYVAAGSCAADETCVVTLSSNYNAHLSKCSIVGEYPNRICCKPGIITPPSDIYWADMNGNPITEAQIVDTVLMIYQNKKDFDYDFIIKEKDIGYDYVKTVTDSYNFGEHLAAKWVITQEDYEAGCCLSGICEGEGEFHFEVNGITTTNGLIVAENSGDNSPPVAGIIGIEDKQIYFKNEILKFNQNSYDLDDDFSYVWDLGNGETKTGDSITKTNYNFDYAYTTPGQKDIILTVTDSRGFVARDKVAILILDETSEQVLAYIDSPLWDAVLTSKKVDFNAMSSYAAEYTATPTPTVTCLAGPCPATTKGCVPPSINYPACQLPVNDYLIKPRDPLTFDWTFINGLYPNIIKTYKASGDAGAVTFIEYDNPTIPSSPHKAILEVSY